MTDASHRPSRFAMLLEWQAGETISLRTLVIALIGIAVPVLAGLALGHAQLGLTIGLGAMLLAGGPAPAAGQARPSPASAALPAGLAIALATLCGAAPLPDLPMIVCAGIAATVSGYSRPVAAASIRFIIYLVLCVNLVEAAGPARAGAALVFGLGALWNVLVRMLLERPKPADAPPARQPAHQQLRTRWLRIMRTLEGWQFPLRLIAGLAIASVLRNLFPAHHYGWIVLTVALLTQRPLEHVPLKLVQRALGTALGVGLTWAILIWVTAPAWQVGAIALLATGAALARLRSYLLYSILSTPVILLIFDFGKTIDTGLLADRLAATAAGAVIVLAANFTLDRAMPKDAGR